MTRKKIVQVLVLTVFIVISIYTIWNQWGNETTGVLGPGQQAPNFTLYDLKGEPLSLSNYAGKTVVLNFWGHWCEPCQLEMPALERIHQKYGDEVVVIGVHLGQEAVTVNHFTSQFGITFPIVFDTPDLSVSKMYGIEPIPDTFIIGPDGVIADVRIGGPVPESWLVEQIEALRSKNGGSKP